MASLTSALAKMGDKEAAAIQILVSPVESDWQKEGSHFISETKKQESDPEKAKFSTPAKTLESVEQKISKPGFEVSIRMVVVAGSEDVAKAHLTNISASFEQFNGDLNGFGGRTVKNKGAFIEDFLYRYQPMFNFQKNHPSVLNIEELATVFHFPNKQISTPHIFWLNAKSAPAPAEIPNEGLYLGMSDFRGIRRPVYITDEDRLRHMYIIGKTGVGKSELLTDMMMQDIKAGKGICFIDPHGDAAEKLLELIPPQRAEDVIYFDPGDSDRPMGINLLEAKTEDQKHFVATSIINLMYKLFDPYKTGIVGPRFEHGVRNAILTALAVPGSTFIEVMKLLQNPGGPYLQRYLDALDDQMVREYWTEQIAHTSEFHKSETLDYTVSKFG